jgi:hypothetical protein
MKKTWRATIEQVPNDDFLTLVATWSGDKTLARYLEGTGWIDEYTNRLIDVEFWMPIPITPNE